MNKKTAVLISTLISIFTFTAPVLAQTRVYKPDSAGKAAAATITTAKLTGYVRFLAHDLLEGRAPASRGDKLSQAYIASQFEALGLKPAGTNGSYFQPFELVSIKTTAPATLSFAGAKGTVQLKRHDEIVVASEIQKPSASIRDAELVFVGYGMVAPEYQWDDYKGMDLRGKVLVYMNNDPSTDPALFAGKRRLYYGRWPYKLEMAAKMGAAGAIIIHTTPSSGYPFQVVQGGFGGEQFMLTHEGGHVLTIQAWMTDDAAKKLARLGGKDLDALRASAEKRDFKPVPLGVKWSATVQNKVKRVQSANVVAVLPGSDKKLASEHLLYTAHYDHFGIKEDAKPGEDNIYNGARDNATGVAGVIALADAFSSLPKAPSRSILFAAVGGEEHGLLGSKYMAKHLPVPAGKVAANINIDELPIWGTSRDVSFIGKDKSNLAVWVDAISAMQGRVAMGDQFPELGIFYRSDQFNFAKLGIPAAFFQTGTQIDGMTQEAAKATVEKWDNEIYHQPSDELRADWDLGGAVQDLQLCFYLGYEVGRAKEMPKWTPGDEFEATRLKALADAAK